MIKEKSKSTLQLHVNLEDSIKDDFKIICKNLEIDLKGMAAQLITKFVEEEREKERQKEKQK